MLKRNETKMVNSPLKPISRGKTFTPQMPSQSRFPVSESLQLLIGHHASSGGKCAE